MQGLYGYKKDHIMSGFRNQAEERRLEQTCGLRVFEQCQYATE